MKAQKANTKKKSVPEKKHAQIGFWINWNYHRSPIIIIKNQCMDQAKQQSLTNSQWRAWQLFKLTYSFAP